MKKILATILSIAIGSSTQASEIKWVLKKYDYQGFPLFIRYPVSLDYDQLQKKYPVRLTVTLTLDEVLDNGLPEAKYNYSIEPLDEYIVGYMSLQPNGQCVLVETFGGKRIYYSYTSDISYAQKIITLLKRDFPQKKLNVETKPDPSWTFIREYSKEFMIEE